MKQAARELSIFLLNDNFIAKYPLYATIFSLIDIIDTHVYPFMAVGIDDKRPVLYVNPGIDLKNWKRIAGLLIHEINHLAFKHLTWKYDDDDFRIVEVAMELCVNEYIPADLKVHLPPGLFLENFRHVIPELKPGQSTRERVKLLKAYAENNGSVTITKLYQSIANPIHNGLCDHVHSEAVEKSIEELFQVCRGRLSDGLKHIKETDRISQELEQETEDISCGKGCSIEWAMILNDYQFGRPKDHHRVSTLSRPNRRFPGLAGIVPGTVRNRRSNGENTAFIIDTSGSMSKETLGMINGSLLELSHFLEKITVIEADERARKSYPYTGPLTAVTGRQGTDFENVLQEIFNGGEYTTIFYATDGFGPYPEKIPTGHRLIWLMTEELDAMNMPPVGEVVKITKEDLYGEQ